MFNKEDIKRLEGKIDDLTNQIRLISERQNSQYTDVMFKLKGLEDLIEEENVGPEDNRSIEELYDGALKAVLKVGKASTSYIQRALQIGYTRAAKIVDMLEERGVIGPATGAKPREVLTKP